MVGGAVNMTKAEYNKKTSEIMDSMRALNDDILTGKSAKDETLVKIEQLEKELSKVLRAYHLNE
jgi:hypothetical protein